MSKEKFRYQDIEKVRVADEDVPGWIKSLREGNFSDEEINLILSRLNKTFKEKNNPNWVDDEFFKLKRYFWKKHGRLLTREEAEYLKKAIRSRED